MISRNIMAVIELIWKMTASLEISELDEYRQGPQWFNL